VNSSPAKVLWISQNDKGIEQLRQSLAGVDVDLRTESNFESGQLFLKNQEVEVVVVDKSFKFKDSSDFLLFAKRHMPSAARVIFSSATNEGELVSLVNEVGIYRVVDTGLESNVFKELVLGAANHSRKTKSQTKILQEISLQNKKLEELTHNLEFLVEERTRSVESSREQDAQQSKIMRGLLGFIKNLSLANIIDDWLGVIGVEVRKIHGVSPPVLAYTTPAGVKRLVTFRGKDLIEVETSHIWPELQEMRAGFKEDQHYLANIFSRPFANVVAVPLGKTRIPTVIYFEYLFSGASLATFLDFLFQRIQPIMLSLDRILLEQQTRFASKQWEQTFDSIQDPVAIIDFDYNLVRHNKSFTQSRVSGKCHKNLASRDDICPGCPVIKSLSSGNSSVSRIRAKDKIYEVHSYPIEVSPGGGITNVINHYVDVTIERKLFSRLVQNEKMVAVGALAANIAHELNNPLTGIRSLAQFLIHDVSSTAQKTLAQKTQLSSDLKEIENAAERSQKTIKNLLEFSQPFEISNVGEFSLNEIVSKTLPLLQSGMRDHRNFVELCKEDLIVKVESHLVQQVVFNLLLNACQAMRQPGQLTISTSKSFHDDKAWAQLTVQDTGHGIAESDQNQIFEPFFTTKGAEQGTGIGLSMSKNVIERYGGKISVVSQVNVGTTFTITLPIVGFEK